jgi:hypothetical protein
MIMDLLAGGGGAAPGPPMMPPADAGGLPAEIPDPMSPPPDPTTTASRTEVQILKELLGLVDEYKQTQGVTEQERMQAEEIGTRVQKLLASNESAAQKLGADTGLSKALGGLVS